MMAPFVMPTHGNSGFCCMMALDEAGLITGLLALLAMAPEAQVHDWSFLMLLGTKA